MTIALPLLPRGWTLEPRGARWVAIGPNRVGGTMCIGPSSDVQELVRLARAWGAA